MFRGLGDMANTVGNAATIISAISTQSLSLSLLPCEDLCVELTVFLSSLVILYLYFLFGLVGLSVSPLDFKDLWEQPVLCSPLTHHS